MLFALILAGMLGLPFARIDVESVDALLKPHNRLRIMNKCGSESLWVAHEAGGATGPDPQNLQVWPGSSVDMTTTNGLGRTRFWAKMKCDDTGRECGIGSSGGPGQSCTRETESGELDYSQCAPPLDSDLQASFGVQGMPCAPEEGKMEGCDQILTNMSVGYTIPFRLKVEGTCHRQDRSEFTGLDCQSLAFAQCPVPHKTVMGMLSAEMKFYIAKEFGAMNTSTVACDGRCKPLKVQPGITFFDRPGDFHKVVGFDEDGCEKDIRYRNVVKQQCKGLDNALGSEPVTCSSGTHYTLEFYCPDPWLPAKEPSLQLPDKDLSQDFWMKLRCLAVIVASFMTTVICCILHRCGEVRHEWSLRKELGQQRSASLDDIV